MNLEEAIELTEILQAKSEPASDVEIFLDTFRHFYLKVPQILTWPAVPIEGPDFSAALEMIRILQTWMPEAIRNSFVLPEAQPKKDRELLQLVELFKVEEHDYAKVLTLKTRYLGGARPEEILEPHRQGISPRFQSDRIYFTLRLLPIKKINKLNNYPVDLQALEVSDAEFGVQDTDEFQSKWRSVVFDEVDYTDIEMMYLNRYTFGEPWKWGRLLRPFVIDRLSLALNIFDPQHFDGADTVPFFHRLIHTGDPAILEESVKKYWADWFTLWSLERTESRSGNPHWRLITQK